METRIQCNQFSLYFSVFCEKNEYLPQIKYSVLNEFVFWSTLGHIKWEWKPEQKAQERLWFWNGPHLHELI